MDRVRAFAAADIPEVARLHQEVFRPDGRTDRRALESYRFYLSQVFLDNPFADPDLPSLVYEDSDGRIRGFLGAAPRRMTAGGRCFQALVSSQFVVDPSSRPALAAVRLAKAFLAGPQDLSICDEATDVSRRIWEGLGGAAASWLSLYWTRPLRPARLVISFLRRRGGALAGVGAAVAPIAAVADSVAARWPRSHFHQRGDCHGTADLDAAMVSSVVSDLNRSEDLHVEHDDRTFTWLLNRAAETRPGGRLMKTVLRDGREMLGWYVWHLDRHGAAEVLQLKAAPSRFGGLLDHLFHDAWRLGADAVSGRIEPRFLQELSDRHCLFHRRGPWLLAHARRPELAQAFQAGRVWFSRLDGEWALAF